MKRIICAMALAMALTAVQAAGTTADRHVARGAACETCHVSKDAVAPVRKNACLACHVSYDKMAERTKDALPNPHFNHYGERDCSTCHKGHEKSVLTCNNCHKFDLVTP